MLTSLNDAEAGVVGILLSSNCEQMDFITLTGADFLDWKLGEIFDAMKAMSVAGKHVTPITVGEANPKIDAVLLFSLTEHATFSYALLDYADIVATNGMRRRLAAVGSGLTDLAAGLSISEMTEKARQMVDDAVGHQKSKVRFVRDILPDVIERLQAKDVFVPSPWPTLNAAIGGLRPGAVYVIAARPGVGKTVIAGQIATELANHGNVAFASLEMTGEELVARLMSERLKINVGKIKDARMNDLDWRSLDEGRALLEGLNIAIDDRSGIAPGDIRNYARTVSRHGKLSGVVVDYLQLMTINNKQDRQAQVAEFSRQLKIMAKDLQVPVIALSQLNRQSETRSDGIPRLSDLRESGAIEQDADVVILLRKEGEAMNESIILDVAKNRHGETGEVELAWQGMFSRAVEWER